MSYDDYFDGYDYFPTRRPKRLTCGICGSRQVYWKEEAPGVWRLYCNEGTRHLCNTRAGRPSPDDFTMVTK